MTDTTHGASESGGYADQVREHSFDGIEEFDNRLPNWWLWTFYGACIFSLFYWLHFHVLGSGDLPGEQYAAAMKAYEENKSKVDVSEEMVLAFVDDPAAQETAAGLWTASACAGCHGPEGQGAAVGPNLTDDYWINGGKPLDIFSTINKGVAEKGMPGWGMVHGEEKAAMLAAYVIKNFKGKNVSGGKEPQGELEKD